MLIIMSQQLLFSVCFQTEHAIQRKEDEAEFHFQANFDRPQMSASKVMLGSMEFPVVQYSIEEEWSRMYFCERITISENSRLVTFEEIAPDNKRLVRVYFPLHLNQIEDMQIEGDDTIIKCEFEHGLWNENTFLGPVLAKFNSDVHLIGLTVGTLSVAQDGLELEYVDDKSFKIIGKQLDPTLGTVHVPGFPSPHYIASFMDEVLNVAKLNLKYSCSFDATECKLAITAINSYDYEIQLNIDGDALALRLGCKKKTKMFRRSDMYTSGVVAPLQQFPNEMAFQIPTRDRDLNSVLTDTFAGWDYVKLDGGWYVPAPPAGWQLDSRCGINQQF